MFYNVDSLLCAKLSRTRDQSDIWYIFFFAFLFMYCGYKILDYFVMLGCIIVEVEHLFMQVNKDDIPAGVLFVIVFHLSLLV